LDSNHRLAVAQLIQRQSTTDPSDYASVNISRGTKEQHYSAPQFITTTFRPELVEAADKCFGIALRNKVSNIYPLNKVRLAQFCFALKVLYILDAS
jgi:chromosome segregation ATPase